MNIAIYHNLPSGGGKRALYEMTKRLAVRHTVDVYTLSTAEHDFCDTWPAQSGRSHRRLASAHNHRFRFDAQRVRHAQILRLMRDAHVFLLLAHK